MSKFFKPEASRDFKVPDPGVYEAICVDVVDIGWRESTWDEEVKVQPKVQFVFEINEKVLLEQEDGPPVEKNFLVFSTWYTLSFFHQAKLLPILKSWVSLDPEAVDKDGFDFDSLVGLPAMLSVAHREDKHGKTRADITGILGAAKNHSFSASGEYVRRENRDDWAEKEPAFSSFGPGPAVTPPGAPAPALLPVDDPTAFLDEKPTSEGDVAAQSGLLLQMLVDGAAQVETEDQLKALKARMTKAAPDLLQEDKQRCADAYLEAKKRIDDLPF